MKTAKIAQHLLILGATGLVISACGSSQKDDSSDVDFFNSNVWSGITANPSQQSNVTSKQKKAAELIKDKNAVLLFTTDSKGRHHCLTVGDTQKTLGEVDSLEVEKCEPSKAMLDPEYLWLRTSAQGDSSASILESASRRGTYAVGIDEGWSDKAVLSGEKDDSRWVFSYDGDGLRLRTKRASDALVRNIYCLSVDPSSASFKDSAILTKCKDIKGLGLWNKLDKSSQTFKLWDDKAFGKTTSSTGARRFNDAPVPSSQRVIANQRILRVKNSIPTGKYGKFTDLNVSSGNGWIAGTGQNCRFAPNDRILVQTLSGSSFNTSGFSTKVRFLKVLGSKATRHSECFNREGKVYDLVTANWSGWTSQITQNDIDSENRGLNFNLGSQPLVVKGLHAVCKEANGRINPVGGSMHPSIVQACERRLGDWSNRCNAFSTWSGPDYVDAARAAGFDSQAPLCTAGYY